jgi:hypothetical protein
MFFYCLHFTVYNVNTDVYGHRHDYHPHLNHQGQTYSGKEERIVILHAPKYFIITAGRQTDSQHILYFPYKLI